MKRLFITLSLILSAVGVFDLKAEPISATATKGVESFDPFWSRCVGAGRANEALRAGWLEHMEMVQENCGFQYVRFHGLFHDDMFPIVENKGKLSYNWQYIDDVFDRLLDLNVRPFVELSFFPKQIAAENSNTCFWWKGNVTPKESTFEEFGKLVKAFTQHCVDRYGIDEVRTWYFEVWNEPNLCRSFFDGTRSQYFELYKQSVTAVRSVDSQLRVGGPSTSNFVADGRYDGEKEEAKPLPTGDVNELEWKGVWIEEFLKYCKKEKLPVDFISTHPYPTDYALDPEVGRHRGVARRVTSTTEDIKWLNKTLAKSAYPNAEIHLTEWNTSPGSRDATHDYLYPAAYIVKTNLDCIGLTHSLAFWTFTDVFEEKGGGHSIFHGGFGMINYQGIVKPSYHAYRMLNQLGTEKLFSNDHLFVSRREGSGKVTALAYNYPEEFSNTAPNGRVRGKSAASKPLNLELTDLKPGTMFKMEILDEKSGNIFEFWKSMGSPEPPTREQVKVMKSYAENLRTETFVVDKDGKLTIDYELTPWCVALIEQIN